jgi:Flp pilus assembly protein CpaB
MWIGPVAAAAAAVLVVWNYAPAPPAPTEVSIIEHPLRPVPVAKAKVPAPSKPVQRKKQVVRQPLEPEEVATEFFPLMDTPPPFARGQLVRMVVPVATMRDVGIPVPPERWNDRVQADVLVGEEGMARAIRFVSYRQ